MKYYYIKNFTLKAYIKTSLVYYTKICWLTTRVSTVERVAVDFHSNHEEFVRINMAQLLEDRVELINNNKIVSATREETISVEHRGLDEI